MRVIKKTLRILCGVVFLAMIALFIYYFDGKDYLNGEVHHYLGTSTVTEGQVVDLGVELTIGGVHGDVSSLGILESGLIEVEYDFYSEEIYLFLTVIEFSYFDTPLFHDTILDKEVYAALGGGIAFIVLLTLFWNKLSFNVPHGVARKMANTMWHLMHPKYILKTPEAISQYSPQVQAPLNIDLTDQGILCVRTWKYKNGYLYSAGIGQACWETKTLLSNKNPEDTNMNGVYAIRLGVIKDSWSEFIKDIIGIVSLKGEWCEHADGVLRAERCDILHLIVSEYHRPISSKLSSVYGLPVTVVDNPTNTYLNWLLKENGFACMVHNSKVMERTHGN